MRRARRRIGVVALIGIVSSTGTAAGARVRVAPYIEAQQVLDVPLTGDRDVLTWTALAAGVDASASGQRVDGTASYRYERRFGWGADLADQDVHSGLARASAILVPNLLTMEAGAIATRARADIRGSAPGFLIGDDDNVTQVYSVFAGPSLATRAGPLDVTASYRFGYTKAETGYQRTPLAAGQAPLNLYDSATNHAAFASVGIAPGTLPVGLRLSGGWERENARPLSQRFDSRFVRGEMTVPVSPTVAVTAGVGYEDIEASQRAVLLDASGAPVVDGRGRFVGDRSRPRLIAYDFDGLLYDVGVLWRPNTRTTLTATVGRRYGALAVTGTFQHQINSASAVSLVVYNRVDSFGRSLSRGLAALPTQFNVPRLGFANNFSGCVFGAEGSGGCLNNAFQSLNTGLFRARGAGALYSAQRGAVTIGAGIGYDERKYLTPRGQPGVVVNGSTDRSVTGQANVGFAFDERSSLQSQAFVAYYDSGLAGPDEVWSAGVGSSYLRLFTDRLSGNAGVTVYATHQESFDTDVAAQLQLGARYQF